jgi:nucleoside-diphosphate-sugar epimerase
MSSILITGNTGYIGRSILNLIINKKNKFIFINKKKTYKKKNIKNFHFKDFKQIKNFNIELLIHLAAIDGENPNPKKIIKENKKIDKILIYLQKNNNIKKILFTSSNKIFENNYQEIITHKTIPKPKNAYGLSKLRTEKIIKNKFKSFLILRLPSVIGPRLKKGLIFRFLKKIKNNQEIKIYNINNKFNNIFDVKDLVKIINIYLKETSKIKKTFNMCSCDDITILDLLKYLHKIMNKKLKIINSGVSQNYKYYVFKKDKFLKQTKFYKIKKIIKNNLL